MRVTGILERAVPISRFGDPAIPSGGLDTSIVAVTIDAVQGGQPVVGFGFGSIGRFARGGLIRERFAPRLLRAPPASLVGDGGHIDPFRAWDTMMAGEKPGGHGERCVAVGALDMALWDIAAKLAGLPLHTLLAALAGRGRAAPRLVPVYAAGGYRYPADDLPRLRDELSRLKQQGYTRAKIKIGGAPLAADIPRIEAACDVFPAANLAVDAMNSYRPDEALAVTDALRAVGLWWLEDACDPLDFETQGRIAERYELRVAAGEALFSDSEARLLDIHGGLRRDRDVLVFDPVHCYGLPGFLRILNSLEARGWPRAAFWPHGGHLFNLHVVAGLGLGGAEVNPLCFQPFGGLPDGIVPELGRVAPPAGPGIGFEHQQRLLDLLEGLLSDAAPAVRR